MREERKTIGALFIDAFEAEAKKIGGAAFLAQGTLYPDVIESVSFTCGTVGHDREPSRYGAVGCPGFTLGSGGQSRSSSFSRVGPAGMAARAGRSCSSPSTKTTWSRCVGAANPLSTTPCSRALRGSQ
jgi:hypothetical protein